MPKWIATVFEDVNDGTPEPAWLVEAPTEGEAAELAMTWFQEHWNDQGNCETVVHVFLAPWDCRVAYKPTTIRVERAELQCCGGPAIWYEEADGHYATCEQRPPGTGQPRPGEPEYDDA